MDELLESFNENGEWDIVSYSITREDIHYICCHDPFPQVNYFFRCNNPSGQMYPRNKFDMIAVCNPRNISQKRTESQDLMKVYLCKALVKYR